MCNTTEQDTFWMEKALEEANRGLFSTYPNPRVGCVTIKNNHCVGSGFHEKAGEPHAEVFALRSAGGSARGATAYVTLEPCAHYGRTPPCAKALIEAGVQRVVIGCVDPNPRVAGKGIQQLEAAGISVTVGVCEKQALRLNRAFFHRMKTGNPWVTLKIACSMDGKTALANGDSKWITGEAAREDVHFFRAQADAIIAGTGSVVKDNALLNARYNSPNRIEQPLRVLIDSQAVIPVDANVFSVHQKVLIATTKVNQLRNYPDFVEVKAFQSSQDSKVSLPALIDELGKRKITQVFVEAGADLAGAFLNKNLVDEVLLYQAPCFLGDKARDLITLPVLESLSDRMRFQIDESRAVGDDWCFSLLKK